MSTRIVLEVTPAGRERGYRATFHSQSQALRFMARKPGSTFAEYETEPLAEEHADLIRALYPACGHGLSAELCGGPMHWYDETSSPAPHWVPQS